MSTSKLATKTNNNNKLEVLHRELLSLDPGVLGTDWTSYRSLPALPAHCLTGGDVVIVRNFATYSAYEEPIGG